MKHRRQFKNLLSFSCSFIVSWFLSDLIHASFFFFFITDLRSVERRISNLQASFLSSRWIASIWCVGLSFAMITVLCCLLLEQKVSVVRSGDFISDLFRA